MEPFNGLGMTPGNLWRLSKARTRSISARSRCSITLVERADAANGGRRSSGPVDLPVLCRRLWPADLRQGRADCPDRGRSAQPDLSRPPLPEGRSHEGDGAVTEPHHTCEVPATVRDEVGGAVARYCDEHDRGPSRRLAPRILAGPHRRRAAVAPVYGFRFAGRRNTRQRGELPLEEAVHVMGSCPDREPSSHLTLFHRPRSGDIVR